MKKEQEKAGVEASAEQLQSFEDVMEMVGTKGAYNIIVIVACASVGLMTPMQVLSAGFLGQTPEYWCSQEDLLRANWTSQQIREVVSRSNDSCLLPSLDYPALAALPHEVALVTPAVLTADTANTTACTSRLFDEGVHSIVTEWDLVCDQRVWYSNTVAASQAGLCIGSILFGYLLDRIGRRVGMLLSIFLFIPSGLLVAASVNVYVYTVSRIAVNAFGMGMYLGGFVLSMELCTPAQRSLVSSYYVIPWAIGYTATAVIAYWVRYWRYLQVALTLPSLLLCLNFWLVTESPRWLAQRGRYQDCLDVLRKMAQRNKKKMPPDQEMLETLQRVCPPAEGSQEPFSVMSWFRTWIVPQFQFKTPLVFFCWFSVSMAYYGVSLGASNLGVNEYVFIFVGGALEVASYLVIYPGVAMLGRRVCLVFTFIAAAVSILGVMGMQLAGYDGDNGGLAFLSYSGKFMITAAFHLVYVVTGELFSTRLRSLMIGEASVCARIGSLSSPYINVLVGSETLWAPSAVFGSLSVAAGLLAMLLPETKGTALDGDERATPVQEQTTLQKGEATAARRGTINPSFELERGEGG